MKITHTTEFFFPEEGGVERHIYYLAKELFAKNKGYEIDVVTSNRFHTGKVILQKQETIEGIKIHRENAKFQKHFFTYFPDEFKTLEKINPDIVHSHAYRHPHVGIAAKYAKKHNKRMVFTPYTIFKGSAELPLKNEIYYTLYDALTRLKIFKKVDSIIALTHFEKNMLVDRGVDEKKISVIPCGGYSFKPIQESQEKEFSVDNLKTELKDKFVIGAMSRIHPSKGIDVLIKALGEIKDEDWVLLLGGKDFGVLNEYLELAKKLGILHKIHYLGFINKTKENFYKACNLFVSPSKAEALGMTLVEAQACGVPVIGSDFGAIRETMLNEVTGFNVPYGDHKLLAEKIKLLMHDDNLRKKFAENALKRGTQFSWQNITNCIEMVYNGEVVDFYSTIRM
jgi:glycosyltransferase involved in cell wall biosynthesis